MKNLSTYCSCQEIPFFAFHRWRCDDVQHIPGKLPNSCILLQYDDSQYNSSKACFSPESSYVPLWFSLLCNLVSDGRPCCNFHFFVCVWNHLSFLNLNGFVSSFGLILLAPSFVPSGFLKSHSLNVPTNFGKSHSLHSSSVLMKIRFDALSSLSKVIRTSPQTVLSFFDVFSDWTLIKIMDLHHVNMNIITTGN